MNVTALMLALLVANAGIAQAQPYPSRPARVVIPYPPGGGADAAARLVANHLSQVLGQPYVLEPRPGGNTLIGTEAVARSAADGYTLLLTGGSTMSIQPFVFQGKLPYDPLRDFAPISMVSRFPFFLVTPVSVPATSLAELVALVRAKPGHYSYASNGTGLLSHLGMEILVRTTGMEMVHVPYKGFAPALPDLLSGRTSAMMADWVVVAPHIKDGRLRALAVTSRERWSSAPEVPTVAELGYPGFDVSSWQGIVVPAGTPREVVERLNRELVKVLASQDVKDQFAQHGAESSPSTPEQFGAYIRQEMARWQKVARDAGVKPE